MRSGKVFVLTVLIVIGPSLAFAAGLWTNEPAGATLLNETPHNLLTGNGWYDVYGQGSGSSIATDSTDPVSPPSVLQQRWPAGLIGGNGGGGGNAFIFPTYVQDVYWGQWFKTDTNFEQHPNGSKIGWIHTRLNGSTMNNQLILSIIGTGPYCLRTTYQNNTVNNCHIGECGGTGTANFYPSSGSCFAGNEWVFIEMYFRPATCTTCTNGVWKIWKNGALVMDITALNSEAIYPDAVSHITVWGGTGSVKSRDSFTYWAHERVSFPNCTDLSACFSTVNPSPSPTPPSPTPPSPTPPSPTPVPTGTPGTVSNLSVVPQSSTTALVSFTAVDDGTGVPAKYDNRLSVSPINWGSASSVASGPCASPFAPSGIIGSTVTCLLSGLTPGQSYQLQNVAFRGTMNQGATYGSLGNISSFTMPSSNVPTLNNFAPASGTIGTSVTISGTNFGATVSANTVKFNGQAGTVTAASPTSLTVTAPDGVTTGKISVQTDQGIVYSEQNFTVKASGNGCGCS